MNNDILIGKITKIKSGNTEYQHFVDLFLKLNNSEVIFNNNKLKFNKNGNSFEFILNLNSSENDGFTETYETFALGQMIRVVKPIGIAFYNLKQESNCKDLFTVGSSLDSDGFAVSFIMTSLNDTKTLEIQYEDILETSIIAIINTITEHYNLINRQQLGELVIRLENALKKKSKLIYDYPKGNMVIQIIESFGFSLTKKSNSSELNIVNTPTMDLISKNFPDLTSDFEDSIRAYYGKLCSCIDTKSDTGHIYTLIIYYTCDLLIEYHNKAGNVLPISIINKITNQVLKAKNTVFLGGDDESDVEILEKINELIRNPNISGTVSAYFRKLDKF